MDNFKSRYLQTRRAYTDEQRQQYEGILEREETSDTEKEIKLYRNPKLSTTTKDSIIYDFKDM